MALIDRESQCPSRSFGLSHIQDGEVECEYCGQRVFKVKGPAAAAPAAVEPETETDDEADLEFTDHEVNSLEFLRWMWRGGRITP